MDNAAACVSHGAVVADTIRVGGPVSTPLSPEAAGAGAPLMQASYSPRTKAAVGGLLGPFVDIIIISSSGSFPLTARLKQ